MKGHYGVYEMYFLSIQNILISDTFENHTQLSANIKYICVKKSMGSALY